MVGRAYLPHETCLEYPWRFSSRLSALRGRAAFWRAEPRPCPTTGRRVHCHLQGDLAIEEGSAEFQVLPSGTIAVETASGREGIILKRQM